MAAHSFKINSTEMDWNNGRTECSIYFFPTGPNANFERVFVANLSDYQGYPSPVFLLTIFRELADFAGKLYAVPVVHLRFAGPTPQNATDLVLFVYQEGASGFQVIRPGGFSLDGHGHLV